MMTDSPSYYKRLNTFSGSNTLLRGLWLTFIVTIILRSTFRTPRFTFKEALFLTLLAAGEALFYKCFAVIAYRIWFHPLSRYPGPFLAKFTDWYSVFQCYLGDRHIDFYNLHRKHGPIIRYGPHRISICTNTALRDIYHPRSNVQKSSLFSVFSHFFKVPTVMTTISRRQHAYKRRILVDALNPALMHGTEQASLKSIKLFCEKLIDDGDDKTGKWSSSRNMTLWCGWLFNDISGDIIFHRNWEMLSSETNRDFFHILGQGTGGLIMVGHMPDILKLKLDRILFPKATGDIYRFQKLAADQSHWRLNQGDSIKEPDIFGALMAARDPETKLSLTTEQLIAESGFLIIAGSETTATAATSTLFYLLHYPNCLDRVRKEVFQRFSAFDEIRSGDQLMSCKYLHACMTEAMRLSPSVGSITAREVLPGKLEVDGHVFPEGVELGVPHYAIQHEEEYFPQPFTFNPSRWLLTPEFEDGVTVQELKIATSAFAAFGVGRTQCIGKQQAYARVMTVIASLVYRFDMRLDPESTVGEGSADLGRYRHRKDEFQVWDQFTARHNGPMVQFRPRQ